jgi:hypothetical protein
MRNIRFAVAALLASCSSAWAGDITFTPQLFDNVGFNVNVTYSANANFGLPGGTNESTSSSPQIDTSGSILGPVYCADPWHSNYLGSSYTVNASSALPAFDNAGDFADASNRIGWILSHAPPNADFSSTAVDERGAMQLAIWYTVDHDNFSYTGGDSGMQSDYNSLVSFVGYNSGDSYGASFYEAQHQGNLFQDLVTVNAVPEPSTVVMGSIGITMLALWGRFRNRKSA